MHRRFAARPVAGFDRRPGIRLFHLRSPCSADRPLRSLAAGGASTATASPSVYAAPNRTQSHTETGGGRRRASGARGTERPGTQPFTSLPSRWRPGGRGPREVRAMLDCEARPLEHPASIHLKLRDELLNAEISTRSPRQRTLVQGWRREYNREGQGRRLLRAASWSRCAECGADGLGRCAASGVLWRVGAAVGCGGDRRRLRSASAGR